MTDDAPTPEDYEREYADLDEKTILVSILAELTAIRHALTGVQREESAGTYRCSFCGHGVARDERERHLRREHDAPDGIDVGEVFGPV